MNNNIYKSKFIISIIIKILKPTFNSSDVINNI